MKKQVLVVMGVSGSGKTTIAKELAKRLGWPFQEGDDLHPPANVKKMQAGTPLTDDDRWPWLDKIATWIDQRVADGKGGVITSSMLKRSYRERVIGTKPGVRLIYLKGDKALIAGQMAKRKGHFMPTTLLDSQFATLEEPQPDERALVVPIEEGVGKMVDAAERALAQAGHQAQG